MEVLTRIGIAIFPPTVLTVDAENTNMASPPPPPRPPEWDYNVSDDDCNYVYLNWANIVCCQVLVLC